MPTQNDHIFEIIQNEKNYLRNELQHLKICQLHYFTTSISVTGLIFGVASGFKAFPGVMYLVPLIVIIPCWWIFLDKATTISRIVGYFRILEKAHTDPKYRYVGWENALNEFRVDEAKDTRSVSGTFQALFRNKIDKLHKIAKLATLRTSHKYWVVIWTTFAVLAVLCLVLSMFVKKAPLMMFALACIAVLVALFITAKTLWDLIYATHTYDHNYRRWKDVLG